jgi:hypothetical protein
MITPPPPPPQIENDKYNSDFYKHIHEIGFNTANILIPMVLDILPKINSVVDFGCGTGTWLSVFSTLGVSEIKGFDGIWVDKKLLKIPEECFESAELDKGVSVHKKYDLAISLEVAEHLPHKASEIFVKTLVEASDIVLFSAAIPFQGGTNHVNEQWPEYWNNLFNKHNYVAIDYFRKRIWDNKNILDCYRQNIMLFVKKSKISQIRTSEEDHCINCPPMPFVLPEIYLKRDIYHISLVELYKRGIKRTIKKILGLKN